MQDLQIGYDLNIVDWAVKLQKQNFKNLLTLLFFFCFFMVGGVVIFFFLFTVDGVLIFFFLNKGWWGSHCYEIDGYWGSGKILFYGWWVF